MPACCVISGTNWENLEEANRSGLSILIGVVQLISGEYNLLHQVTFPWLLAHISKRQTKSHLEFMTCSLCQLCKLVIHGYFHASFSQHFNRFFTEICKSKWFIYDLNLLELFDMWLDSKLRHLTWLQLWDSMWLEGWILTCKSRLAIRLRSRSVWLVISLQKSDKSNVPREKQCVVSLEHIY